MPERLPELRVLQQACLNHRSHVSIAYLSCGMDRHTRRRPFRTFKRTPLVRNSQRQGKGGIPYLVQQRGVYKIGIYFPLETKRREIRIGCALGGGRSKGFRCVSSRIVSRPKPYRQKRLRPFCSSGASPVYNTRYIPAFYLHIFRLGRAYLHPPESASWRARKG